MCTQDQSRINNIFISLGNEKYRTTLSFAWPRLSRQAFIRVFNIFRLKTTQLANWTPLSPLYRGNRRYEFSPAHQCPATSDGRDLRRPPPRPSTGATCKRLVRSKPRTSW